MLQFSLVGNVDETEVITDSAEDAAIHIAVAVAEVLASVTGMVRASAQQGCEIDLDPVARVRATPCKLHTCQCLSQSVLGHYTSLGSTTQIQEPCQCYCN